MGTSSRTPRRRWGGLVPAFAALMVVVEIAFLGRLDIASKAEMLQRYWVSYSFSPPSRTDEKDEPLFSSPSSSSFLSGVSDGAVLSCEKWLEREDNVSYSRDFAKEPILVVGLDKDWNSCSVGCKVAYGEDRVADASFGLPQNPQTASVLRSMESSHYYPENNIDLARRKGFKIIMTTSLSSDVPVGYFSWAEYDIMAPLQPKTETPLAAAFISNCGARNFRLEALEMLEKLNISIDSYGSCHRTRDGKVDKVETLKKYKFSLAFENSNEEDYVTEKFFQSIVAGAIPVVVGAPNIQDFAPAPGSILHVREIGDVASIAQAMRHISTNPEAFKQSVKWKYEGPSDSFKALVDMAAVHSSCRLCIHLATSIHEEEEKTNKFRRRPCKCVGNAGTVYHLFVRERGRFALESLYLRSEALTLRALESAVVEKFRSSSHVPIWRKERPASIRGEDELKLYKIYPVGITQRQALYSFRFRDDAHLRRHVERNPCAKFEVIFL